MRRTSGTAGAVLATFAALALASPWARGQAPAAAPHAASAPPALADMMLLLQVRHHKLWLAGDARNWELAAYEAHELAEALERVGEQVPTYDGMPVGKMIESTMTAPLGQLEDAAKARDAARFAVAFDAVTAACNSCHAGANRAFVVIQRPGAGPFSNQSFAPVRP